MIWFPQLSAGTLAQLPLKRARHWRRIENQLEGGESISLPDAASSEIEWTMSWKDLSDAEAQALRDHFSLVHGTCQPFGFVDPLANLIAWSEDLSKADWQADQLVCTGGAEDPFGSHGAWTISNPAAGEQSLTQSISLPGAYAACFSVWLRSNAPGEARLQRDSTGTVCSAGQKWGRFFVSAAGSGTSGNFSLMLDAGASIQAFGFQLEAQPYPSQYKKSRSARGIYTETRFAAEELTLTATGQGLTACEIALVSRI